MKKKILRAITILTLVTAAFSVTGWAVSVMRSQNNQKPEPAQSLRPKKVREIARERDVEISLPESDTNLEWDDLSSLTRNSVAIVAGQITEEESRFSGNNHVLTYYNVDVKRALYGPKLNVPLLEIQNQLPPLTTPLTIFREGGVVYENGHRVSVKLKGSDSLKVGQDYVFFLWWSSRGVYQLAAGVSGAFLVEDNLRIKPLGDGKELRRKYHGMDMETFINEVLQQQ